MKMDLNNLPLTGDLFSGIETSNSDQRTSLSSIKMTALSTYGYVGFKYSRGVGLQRYEHGCNPVTVRTH